MSDIAVRTLDEAHWETYRTVRLQALQESPEAFVSTYAAEAAESECFWQERMRRSRRIIAAVNGVDVGVVSVGRAGEDRPQVAQLFGLWVAPSHRGTGVATALVRAGASQARAEGRSHVAYWVGTDNGRAVAFASGFGFRPDDGRRPMRVGDGANDEQEIMMILPLGDDRGQPNAN